MHRKEVNDYKGFFFFLFKLYLCTPLVCHLLRTGVAAIFGPQSSQTASHVQSICDTMEVRFYTFYILSLMIFCPLGSSFRDSLGLSNATRKLSR